MKPNTEIVITGVGVVSPIGAETDEFWTSLCEHRSGVRPITLLDIADPERPICGECPDFNPKPYLKQRKSTKKSIKMMSRDIQLGYVAAFKACEHAGAGPDTDGIDPERFGVLYGADMIGIQIEELTQAYQACLDDAGKFDILRWGANLSEIYPLWMLKYLPNMPACHIGIGQDARGPSDSVTLDRVSGLAAISEAYRTIERGQADIAVAGATSSYIHPNVWARATSFDLSEHKGDPTTACRPFDADRDGSVLGEGSAAFVLETLEHAERRGATPIARIRGFAHRFQWIGHGGEQSKDAIVSAIQGSLDDAGMTSEQIGHVNADGLSTIAADRAEAQAIRATLGDVPVTAPKSYFGNLSAATGAVEMVASVLGLQKGLVPPTLNYDTPDPECPINVVSGDPLSGTKPTAMLLNQCRNGRTAAVIIERV